MLEFLAPIQITKQFLLLIKVQSHEGIQTYQLMPSRGWNAATQVCILSLKYPLPSISWRACVSIRIEQVTQMYFAALADCSLGFSVSQVPDPLQRIEMKFNPEALVIRVDETEGVRAKTVNVAVAGRDATITHDHCDLVQRLGQGGPEVPVVRRASQIGLRIALHRVVEVRVLAPTPN